jgi:hypothetical protein
MVTTIRSNLLASLVLCASASLVAASALAQDANYMSVEATSGKAIQLSYHASAHKNCTSAPLPTVHVMEPPTSGMLTVRVAELTTARVVGCPQLKTPARVIFYESRTGYVGSDHVNYEVTSENGEVVTYNVTITVKAARVPNRPMGDAGTRKL